jgi:hypothetical protein
MSAALLYFSCLSLLTIAITLVVVFLDLIVDGDHKATGILSINTPTLGGWTTWAFNNRSDREVGNGRRGASCDAQARSHHLE